MKRSEEPKESGCFCPYCEEGIVLEISPFCQSCQIVLRYCSRCRIVVEREATVCPQCGQPLE